MLTTALPLLPPPATSLLPPLHNRPNPESSSTNDGQHSLQAQQQRRARGHPHGAHPRSQLAMLALDERVITQRKLAIQMFGYSWLKPAGCTKTMLGRREEELEREEVERQLRDVEMQEQTAAQMEEAQRQAQLDEQRQRELRGEDVGADAERDLDEEVPDMDATAEFDDEGSDENDEDLDEIDLDNEIPEETSYAYDTTRDPDTESESEQQPSVRLRVPQGPSSNRTDMSQGGQPELSFNGSLMAQSAGERDLDDDVPEMEVVHDLDDDVPDANSEEGGWEHTDTELSESDMDISIMPPGVTAHHLPTAPPSSGIGQRQRRQPSRQSLASQQSDTGSDMRRTSGNVPLPMAPPARPAAGRGMAQSSHLPNFTPDQLGSDFSVSALISTGNTDMSSAAPGNQGQRAWLDPASARRNLFGASRDAPAPPAAAPSRSTSAQQGGRSLGGAPNRAQPQMQAPRQVSSGGLFTPSPQLQQQHHPRRQGLSEEPQSRTRSGRAMGRSRGGRA